MKIPAAKNVSVAEFEKLSKYKDLEIKVEKLWHMKTVTIPVVIEALGMSKQGTEKHLEEIPGSFKTCWNVKNSTYKHCSYPKKNLIYVKRSKNEHLKQRWMYLYRTKID